MTLNNVLNIGVLGVLAQSNRINAVSDNIANVNTVGYKRTEANFQTLVNGQFSTGTPYFPGGVASNSRQLNGRQGDITRTDSVTDISISGEGFFPVSDSTLTGSALLFTRAGSFSPDRDGYLQNTNGFYLQGWALDADGNLPTGLQSSTLSAGAAITSLTFINTRTIDSFNIPTTSFALRANLNAQQAAYDPANNPDLTTSGNITFTANPTAGDTITLNGVTWEFVASGATGNQTNIGVTLADTLTQLAADLTASANTSLTPANYTGTATTLDITYGTNSVTGLTYSLASSSVNGVVSGANLHQPYATGNITFTANPSNGHTITLNGITWTFVTSGANGNQTNIGATLADTLTQLATDLNNSPNNILNTASFAATATSVNVTSRIAGLVGDNYSLASGNSNAVASGAHLLLPPTPYDPTLATNNMSGGAVAPHFNRSLDVIDNNGGSHQVRINFLKTANNTWAVELTAIPATDVTIPGGQIAYGTMTFNGDGTLASVSPALSAPITFPWTSTGTTPTGETSATVDNVVAINWGTAGVPYGTPGATVIGLGDGLQQMSANYSVRSAIQNGSQRGTLKDVSISDDGIISANFSNGTTRPVYAIPLARFYNPNALQAFTSNVYGTTADAGIMSMFQAGHFGAGRLQSGTLEESNVDLADQLTDIVIAQRAYQANTKLITTSDDMLQQATDMLR